MTRLFRSRLLHAAALLCLTVVASAQEDKPTPSPFSLNLRVGLTNSQVGINYSTEMKWYGYDRGFRAGIEYERPFPNRTRAWSGAVEISYQAFTANKDGYYPSRFEFQAVEMNIGLRRYFSLSESVQCSLLVGTALSVGQSAKEHYTYLVVHYTSTNIEEYEWRPPLIAGIGITVQRFTLEFRYSYRSGQHTFFSRPASMNQWGANLVYSIVKK